jgi:hypothetical protein
MTNFIKKFWREELIIILVILCYISFRACSDNKKEAERWSHNTEAALDSVRYYQTKSGEIYAEKLAYIATQKELEDINKELYDEVTSLNKKLLTGTKSKILIKDTIKLPGDTIYIDKTLNYQLFDIPVQDSTILGKMTLELHYKEFLKPKSFDYTINLPVSVYLTKDYSVLLKSRNNVIFTDVQSFIDPSITNKPVIDKKRWSFGIQTGLGIQYDVVKKDFGVGGYMGVGVTYQLFSW